MNRPLDTGIPDVLLERLRLGELAAPDAARLRDWIASDPTLAARLRALEDSEAQILAQYPSPLAARAIRARLASETESSAGRARGRWLLPAMAVLAFAVVGLPLLLTWRQAPTERVKGAGPSLVVFRKTVDGSEALEPGAVVRKGDLLRIGYRSAARGFGVIVSIDGRGSVTQHLPPTGEMAAKLEPEGTVLLDFSFELDDAPAGETFILVTSDSLFTVSSVRAALAALPPPPVVGESATALPLPRGLTATVLALRKETP